tara:strand:- start:26 stop:742 length:717 start_codon:yes stop_codon:yes gene_type:complete
MSFYKTFIAFAIVISLAFFFSNGNPNLDSIKKESNKIILYDSDQINKIITLNEDNGQIIKIETYVDGNKNNVWIPNYPNISDEPDSVAFYGNGQIKEQGYLTETGQQHSLWEYFDRHGHLLIQRFFSYGEPTTIWIWYDHDNHNQISNYELYDDARDDGSLTRYYRPLKINTDQAEDKIIQNIKEIKSYHQHKLTGDYTLFFNALDSSGNQLIQLQGKYGAGDDLGIKVGEWQKFEKK